MFNYNPSHEEIVTQCTINENGYGADARMQAEFDVFSAKELAWAREVVSLADIGIMRYSRAVEAEREAVELAAELDEFAYEYQRQAREDYGPLSPEEEAEHDMEIALSQAAAEIEREAEQEVLDGIEWDKVIAFEQFHADWCEALDMEKQLNDKDSVWDRWGNIADELGKSNQKLRESIESLRASRIN